MKEYCLGLMFDEQKSRVALIKKNKPEWQSGKYNFIGGAVEYEELPIEAMIREFREEAGINTNTDEWKIFCILNGKNSNHEDFIVYIYKCFSDKVFKVKTCTSEEVHTAYTLDFKKSYSGLSLSNVPWLLEMALDNANFIAKINYR